MTGAYDGQGRARLLAEHRIEQQIERGAPRRGHVAAQHLAELTLRIEIDLEHALSALASQVVAQIRGERGLSAPTLLIDACDVARNQYPSPGDGPLRLRPERPWPLDRLVISVARPCQSNLGGPASEPDGPLSSTEMTRRGASVHMAR